MRKRRLALVLLLAVAVLALVACSQGDYQYYSAEQLKESIEAGQDLFLLDTQLEEEFESHHIEGAVPTYAYPAQSAEDKAKLDQIIPELENTDAPIIVICPGGGSGATRTIDYLVEQGIGANQFYILENGQNAWEYEGLLAN